MVAGERRQVPGERRGVQQGREGRDGIGQGECGELMVTLRRAPPPGRAAQIEETAAADRAPGRPVPQHKAILRRGGDWPFQHQLDVSLAAGLNRILPQKNDPGANVGRGMV
ncbi:MAG TPA: hypothetical protein VH222_05085 [Phenylobacterium sp.]|nr:hypothetical protein [Phenylobacterium sp.]HEX4709808.1 hypothetical protein [Phenylobacterium sp.]